MSPTRGDRRRFKNEDLVLKVTTNIDPGVWNESKSNPSWMSSADCASIRRNPSLRDLLPEGAKVRAPKVINASETIVDGSVCVENYHAILQHVKSSIRDSLAGRGARVAVFNDEAHHVANETGAKFKKWKEFLLNPEYGFRYVVGVSGTCYIGDDYFADVASRYSLRQAIEERFVKKVEYVAEMPQTDNPDEKWQLIFNRHQDWKKRFKKQGIHPMTIIVTKASCV